jgi:SAM-dependent methyltransferase
MSSSLHDEITRAYYQTTAVRGHAPTREHYERVSAGLLRKLGPWLPTDRATPVLELACGNGELLYALERAGFTRTAGVDLCAEELDQARGFVRAELACMDIVDRLRRTPDRSVGMVVAFNILEHLPKDVLGTVLKESARVLRPGGSLVAQVPNAISPFGGLTRHWDMTHEWAFTPNNFRQLAAVSGFDPRVEFRECRPVVHGVKSAVRFGLWQLLRAGIRAWFLIETGDGKGGVYTMDMLVRLRTPGPGDAA